MMITPLDEIARQHWKGMSAPDTACSRTLYQHWEAVKALKDVLPSNTPLPPLPLSGNNTKQATGLDSDECSFILAVFFTPQLTGILDIPPDLTRGGVQLRLYQTGIVVKHLMGGARVHKLWLEELRAYWFTQLSAEAHTLLIQRAGPIKKSVVIPAQFPVKPSFLPLPPASSSASSHSPTPFVAKVVTAFPALPPVPPATARTAAMNALVTAADTASASSSQTPPSSQSQSQHSEDEDKEMTHHDEVKQLEEEEEDEEDDDGEPTEKKLDPITERYDADWAEFRRLQQDINEKQREIRTREREVRRQVKLKARLAQRLQQAFPIVINK